MGAKAYEVYVKKATPWWKVFLSAYANKISAQACPKFLYRAHVPNLLKLETGVFFYKPEDLISRGCELMSFKMEIKHLHRFGSKLPNKTLKDSIFFVGPKQPYLD